MHLGWKVNIILLSFTLPYWRWNILQLIFHQHFLKFFHRTIQTLSSSNNSTKFVVFKPHQLWSSYLMPKVQSIFLSLLFQKLFLITTLQNSWFLFQNHPTSQSKPFRLLWFCLYWWLCSILNQLDWRSFLKIFCFFWFFYYSTRHYLSSYWKVFKLFIRSLYHLHNRRHLETKLIQRFFERVWLQLQACNLTFYHQDFLIYFVFIFFHY